MNVKNDLEKIKIVDNKIYSNILSEEDCDKIYSVIDINQTHSTSIVGIYAQKVWFVDIPQFIKDKVTQIMSEANNQRLKLEEISFARYSKEYGDFPVLTPHYDNTFKQPRITLDIQLKSNINWPIVVEGRTFQLKDRDGLTFSGTHQIHWREIVELKDNDFVEMLFCHFSLENKSDITIDEKIKIEQKMMLHSNQFATMIIKENKRLKNIIKSYTYE